MVSLWSVTKAYEGQANDYRQSSQSNKKVESPFAPKEIVIPGITDTSFEMIPEFWKHSAGTYSSIAVPAGYQPWT